MNNAKHTLHWLKCKKVVIMSQRHFINEILMKIEADEG